MPSSHNLESTAARLIEHLRGMRSCLIALSGGVDSAVVAQAAWLALPGNALAVTGIGAAVSLTEIADARSVAKRIGIPHLEVPTDEIARSGYRQNAPDRCFHCKTELYSQLQLIASERHIDVILNGANQDDLGDYRPGMQAATDFAVRSPLLECGLGKVEVRQLANYWDLPIHNKPASPCLASRIAYGVEVTEPRLRMIEMAESYLRRILPGVPVRVRFHEGEIARVEVPAESILRLLEESNREELVTELKGLGFRAVTIDLEGFRSGSLNSLVQIDNWVAQDAGR
jgi:pyridinium-3,5-biscarboxylic acid mononucleotide sulfurtransferase